MENQPKDKFINSTPFPVTPTISEDTLKEISEIEMEILAPGIVVFRNAFKIDQKLVLDYIDSKSQKAHETRWNYITGEDGVEYGINEDGFRYRLEDVPATPVRLLHPVTDETPEEVKKAFRKKLSLIHHPDRNNGERAKFQEISDAYDIITGKGIKNEKI